MRRHRGLPPVPGARLVAQQPIRRQERLTWHERIATPHPHGWSLSRSGQRREPDVVRGGIGGEEAQQASPLGGHRGPRPLVQPGGVVDDDGGGLAAAAVIHPPGAAHEAVVEHRPADLPLGTEQAGADPIVGRERTGCGRRGRATGCRTRAGTAGGAGCRGRAGPRRGRRTVLGPARRGTAAAAGGAGPRPPSARSGATTSRRRPRSPARRPRSSA